MWILHNKLFFLFQFTDGLKPPLFVTPFDTCFTKPLPVHPSQSIITFLPPPPFLWDPVNAPGGWGAASSASPLEAPVWICLTRPVPAMDAHIHEGWRGEREREGATFNLPKLIEIPISCYKSSLIFFIFSFIPQQSVLFNVRFIRSYR